MRFTTTARDEIGDSSNFHGNGSSKRIEGAAVRAGSISPESPLIIYYFIISKNLKKSFSDKMGKNEIIKLKSKMAISRNNSLYKNSLKLLKLCNELSGKYNLQYKFIIIIIL